MIHDSGLCFLYISTVNAKNYKMWLYSVCQHIPGVTECEQTQVESCGEIVKKLGKDLNVSHLWPYTPWYSGQIAQSLHACFPSLKQEWKSLFSFPLLPIHAKIPQEGKWLLFWVCKAQSMEKPQAPNATLVWAIMRLRQFFASHCTALATTQEIMSVCYLWQVENSPFFPKRLYQ